MVVMLGKGIFLEFRDCENDDATLGQVKFFLLGRRGDWSSSSHCFGGLD